MVYLPSNYHASIDDLKGAGQGIVLFFLGYIVYEKLYQRIMLWLQRQNDGKSKGSSGPSSQNRCIADIISGGIFLLIGVLLYNWVSQDLGVLLCVFPILLTIGKIIYILRSEYNGEKEYGEEKDFGEEEDSGQAEIEPDPETLLQLEQLKRHLDAGLITKEEYRQKRKAIEKNP